jgi:hypothetical protein
MAFSNKETSKISKNKCLYFKKVVTKLIQIITQILKKFSGDNNLAKV